MSRPRMIDWSDDDLARAVARSLCYMDVMRELGYKTKGGAWLRIKQRINDLDLDTSHFNRSLVNQRNAKPGVNRKAIEDYFVEDGTSPGVRKILASGLFTAQCSWCGVSEWRGQAAPLELDHINGNRRDNRRENLRLLCCNCHAQTPTYKVKNHRRYRTQVDKVSATC